MSHSDTENNYVTQIKTEADLAERNLAVALLLGLITWFQYFELYKLIGTEPAKQTEIKEAA